MNEATILEGELPLTTSPLMRKWRKARAQFPVLQRTPTAKKVTMALRLPDSRRAVSIFGESQSTRERCPKNIFYVTNAGPALLSVFFGLPHVPILPAPAHCSLLRSEEHTSELQ